LKLEVNTYKLTNSVPRSIIIFNIMVIFT